MWKRSENSSPKNKTRIPVKIRLERFLKAERMEFQAILYLRNRRYPPDNSTLLHIVTHKCLDSMVEVNLEKKILNSNIISKNHKISKIAFFKVIFFRRED